MQLPNGISILLISPPVPILKSMDKFDKLESISQYLIIGLSSKIFNDNKYFFLFFSKKENKLCLLSSKFISAILLNKELSSRFKE